MAKEDRTEKQKPAIKVLMWFLIAIYTYNLPNARLVYNFLVDTIGQELTGKIPLVLVAAAGLIYLAILMITRRSLTNMLFLIPCGVIAYTIITLEPNPNKHIHIPEYVLMAWLLYAALSSEYNQADLLILIFILTSMLGVVDEIEQGIHPSRFYGWSDMLVNSASALIGVLTIMGLTDLKKPDYSWKRYFRKDRLALWGTGLGIISVIAMAYFLFEVQKSEKFAGVYPGWLLIVGAVFVALAILIAIRLIKQEGYRSRNQKIPTPVYMGEKKIARHWVLPALAILVYMHVMVFYIALSGSEFL